MTTSQRVGTERTHVVGNASNYDATAWAAPCPNCPTQHYAVIYDRGVASPVLLTAAELDERFTIHRPEDS